MPEIIGTTAPGRQNLALVPATTSAISLYMLEKVDDGVIELQGYVGIEYVFNGVYFDVERKPLYYQGVYFIGFISGVAPILVYANWRTRGEAWSLNYG